MPSTPSDPGSWPEYGFSSFSASIPHLLNVIKTPPYFIVKLSGVQVVCPCTTGKEPYRHMRCAQGIIYLMLGVVSACEPMVAHWLGRGSSQIFTKVQHNSCEGLSSAGKSCREVALTPCPNTSPTKARIKCRTKEQLRQTGSLLR